MYFNALLELFGLNPDDYVQNEDLLVDDDIRNKLILLDEKSGLKFCPECEGKCNVHTHYLTKKRFHPDSNYEVTFVINRIQYRCTCCGKTHVFS